MTPNPKKISTDDKLNLTVEFTYGAIRRIRINDFLASDDLIKTDLGIFRKAFIEDQAIISWRRDRVKYSLDYKKPPSFLDYVRGAKARGFSFALTRDEFDSLVFGDCFLCGTAGPNGLDRVDNILGYSVGNCRSCCKHCNYAKGALPLDLFLEWASRLAANKEAWSRLKAPAIVRYMDGPCPGSAKS